MRLSVIVLTLLPLATKAQAEEHHHEGNQGDKKSYAETKHSLIRAQSKLRGTSATTNKATLSYPAVESGEKDPPNPDYFKPAMPIEFFQNIDPGRFEWVNPAEVQAGETTCGFLKAPFAWPAGSTTGFTETDDQDQYPIAKVYVCVRFADVQPAPRGNMAVHCGGPRSISACVTDFYSMGGHPHRLGYNVIGFDQRGMGRSTPTFVVPECTDDYYGSTEYLSQSDVEVLSSGADLSDEAYVRAKARWAKARNLGCWNHEDFLVPVDETDEYSETYHFLQYSGTRQLAEDIERTRIIFGDQKLSVYGISYGTAVMGTYATVFPKNVNLMVLDGNMIPSYDVAQFSEDEARSSNQRIDYFIASCEMGNGNCGVKDMSTCLNKLSDINREHRDEIQETYGEIHMSYFIQAIISNLFGDVDQAPLICAAAEEGDFDTLFGLIKELLPPPEETMSVILQGNQDYPEVDTESKPTVYIQLNCDDFDSESKPTLGKDWCRPDWPFEGYLDNDDATFVVMSQDLSFGAYDEDLFVRFFQDLTRKYPGAGTQEPASKAANVYGRAYYWPNITPLAPMGNPDQRGIVAGQLYDPATPYIWTQKMRQAFKHATLLTSRSVNHGMGSARLNGDKDPVCQGHVNRYFEKGYVDFVDGHVCESEPIGDSCTINDIITDGRCNPSTKAKAKNFESVASIV